MFVVGGGFSLRAEGFAASVLVLVAGVLLATIRPDWLFVGGLMATLFLAERAAGVGVGLASGIGCLAT